jgi:hypothetical protein
MHSAVLSPFMNLPTILGKEYKIWSSSFLMSLLPLQVQTFSSALCFQKLNLCSSVRTRNQVSLPHKTTGKTAYASLLSNVCYMSHPPHASLIDYLSNICDDFKLWISSLHSFLLLLPLSLPKYSSQHLFSIIIWINCVRNTARISQRIWWMNCGTEQNDHSQIIWLKRPIPVMHQCRMSTGWFVPVASKYQRKLMSGLIHRWHCF